MLTLGRDAAGRVVKVAGLSDIDQVDWAVGPEGEYRYEFLIQGFSGAVIIFGPQLADGGREAADLWAADYDL